MITLAIAVLLAGSIGCLLGLALASGDRADVDAALVGERARLAAREEELAYAIETYRRLAALPGRVPALQVVRGGK